MRFSGNLNSFVVQRCGVQNRICPMITLRNQIHFLIGFVLFSLGMTHSELHAQVARNADVVQPGRLYVKFNRSEIDGVGGKTGLPVFDEAAARYGVESLEKAFPFLDVIAQHRRLRPSTEVLRRVYSVSYSRPYAPETIARALAKDPAVVYAEPVPVHHVIGRMSEDEWLPTHPNDPRYLNQVHLARMKLPEAWDVVKGDAGNVVIGIVDSGNDWEHPDLLANVWTNPGEVAGNGIDDDNNGFVDDVHGWNFGEEVPDAYGAGNYSFHGTAVAGTAAAVTDNERGIAGSSWNAKFIPINANCADQNLLCFTMQGVMYAALNGAHVINTSFGSKFFSQTERSVYEAAEDEGALVVASAGNDGVNADLTPFFPAGYLSTLSVGGTYKHSNQNAFNFGRSINVFAPGISIDVTNPRGGYGQSSGTSFSAPLTAGVAALVKTAFPQFTPPQLREQIRLTADNIDDANSSVPAGLLGRGLVNAERAVTEAPRPGVRLVEFDYENQNGNQDLQSGDAVRIRATFTNFHGDASSLTIGFASDDDFVDWASGAVSVGALPNGASQTLEFSFTISGDAPDNRSAILFTRIAEGAFEDTPDVVRIPINQRAAALHQTSGLKVSITNEGNIGYTKFQGEVGSQGQGFRILDKNNQERDPLFEGGLLIATGANQVMDCIRGAPGSGQDHDFVMKAGEVLEVFRPGSLTTQEGRVVLTDVTASNSIGVDILQESYVEDTPGNDAYLILKYTVTNAGPTTLENLHIGLFFDWDVDLGGAVNDRTHFNSDLGVGYVTDSEGSLAVGVRMLSTTGGLSYRAIHNPDEIYGGFSDAKKWRFLSGGLSNVIRPVTDASQIIASGPHTFEPSESIEVAFAVIGGKGSDDLISNAERAKELWDNVINARGAQLTLPDTIADQIYTQGEAISDLVFPEATGGTPPYSYTLTPAAPSGLAFDAATRTLSGRPSSVMPSTQYTFMAIDATAASTALQFSIEVLPALSSENAGVILDDVELQGHYPNPFSVSANILFGLPEPADVTVTLIDMLGREVLQTDPMRFAAGKGHTVIIHGEALAAGAYLYRLVARTLDKEFVRTGALLRVRD